MHIIFFAYAVFVMSSLILGEVKDDNLYGVTFLDTTTGREFPADFWSIAQYVLVKNLGLSMLILFAGLMDLTLTGFLSYHLYLIYIGETTNESFKWTSIKKLHSKLVLANKKFLRLQKESETSVSSSVPDSDSATTVAVLTSESTVKDDVKGVIQNVGVSDHPITLPTAAPVSTDFATLGDEYVCVESASSYPDASDVLEVPPKDKVAEVNPLVKESEKEKDEEEDDDEDEEEEEEGVEDIKTVTNKTDENPIIAGATAKVPPVLRHPIRAALENDEDFPDVLEKHPGPMPPNIYRKGLFKGLW